MGWTLRIYTPTGGPHVSGSLIAEYTEYSPGGIVSGFRWSRAPHGDCLQMEFAAVPKLVDIPPRAIVHFLVDGVSAFYGFVARGWPAGDSRVRRYLVMGASYLLRYRVGSAIYNAAADTGAIVRDLISQYGHPAIRYDPGLIPKTGYVLQKLEARWIDLHKLFSDLAAATPGISWGVDADGRFYFRSVSSVAAVRYEDGIHDALPIEAMEVWDEVILLAPPELAIGSYKYNTGAGYGAQKVFLVGAELMSDSIHGIAETDLVQLENSPLCTTNRGGSWFSCTQVTARGYINDRNPNTGVRKSWAVVRSYSIPQRVPAAYLDAVVVSGCGLLASVVKVDGAVEIVNLGNQHQGWVQWPQSLQGVLITKVFLQPNYCYGGGSNDYALYEAGFTYWDTAAASRVAQALTRTPYISPSQVEVAGYVAPATTLTLLGAPGGDVSAPVAELEYGYTIERGLRTIIRIGTTLGETDPTSSAIRIAASLLDNATVTSVRKYVGG